MIKPMLKDMTKSELHAVMTGGFATIAGSVLAAYISFGVSVHLFLRDFLPATSSEQAASVEASMSRQFHMSMKSSPSKQDVAFSNG